MSENDQSNSWVQLSENEICSSSGSSEGANSGTKDGSGYDHEILSVSESESEPVADSSIVTLMPSETIARPLLAVKEDPVGVRIVYVALLSSMFTAAMMSAAFAYVYYNSVVIPKNLELPVYIEGSKGTKTVVAVVTEFPSWSDASYVNAYIEKVVGWVEHAVDRGAVRVDSAVEGLVRGAVKGVESLGEKRNLAVERAQQVWQRIWSF